MSERKGILLILATALISGVSIYVNSLGVKFGNPYVFAGMKNLFVGLILFSIVLGFKERHKLKKLVKKDWWQLTLIGLVGGAVPFLLFFKGLTLTIPAKGSFIHKTLFIYVTFLAIIYLKEKISKSMLIGLGALLVGIVLFLGIQPQALVLGDLLILIATLMWAGEIIMSKKLLKRISPNIVVWGRMFFGGLFILLFLINTRQIESIFAYNPQQWMWIGITSVFLLGYVLTFYNGLKYVRASVATSILALGAPITGIITLVVQGGIVWAPEKYWGMALIVTGIILVAGIKMMNGFVNRDHLYDRIDS
ncbi:MAG: DMT family transporter [Candidatus Kerfeldbacteria bacterium]|jgi:drug/metabolite transporter (DMT)-like permease